MAAVYSITDEKMSQYSLLAILSAVLLVSLPPYQGKSFLSLLTSSCPLK